MVGQIGTHVKLHVTTVHCIELRFQAQLRSSLAARSDIVCIHVHARYPEPKSRKLDAMSSNTTSNIENGGSRKYCAQPQELLHLCLVLAGSTVSRKRRLYVSSKYSCVQSVVIMCHKY